jgi:hypothetical protein
LCSWDTAMSQKSRFKMQTQGNFNYRWTFPQLPWGTVKNPQYIQTSHGYDSSVTSCHICFLTVSPTATAS